MMPTAPEPHLREPPPRATLLTAKLAARIAASGPVSFHDYMEACLYDPEHGYYTNAAPIGREGDFITAPEISQVFGELIGLWAGEVWLRMGSPSGLRLVELGPGRGLLMADALRALRVLPAFLKTVAVDLIETSRRLKPVQEGALAQASCPIFWRETLEQAPAGPTILIANEFFDCLPVRQFSFDEAAGAWRERRVGLVDERLGYVSGAPATLPGEAPPDPMDGDIFEYRPGVARFMREFAKRAEAAPFAALIIDYGSERQGPGDTAQAVRTHRFADVFDAAGETDLTAHVNFSHLKEEAEKAGLSVFGPRPMGQWLLQLGLEARAGQLLKGASEDDAAAIKAALMRLVDPKQMGVLFKAMALTHGASAPPPPFA